MPPGAQCDTFYKRKDGTTVKYQRSMRQTRSRPGSKPRMMNEAMDPKALEEAMSNMHPDRKARLIASPPGTQLGAFFKRKDVTIMNYKRSSRPGYIRPRPYQQAMDPKAMEEAMSNMRPKKKARIIALIPSSRSGRFYRRRDGTIAKYKQLPRSSRPGYKRPFARKQKEAMA